MGGARNLEYAEKNIWCGKTKLAWRKNLAVLNCISFVVSEKKNLKEEKVVRRRKNYSKNYKLTDIQKYL